MLSEKLVKQATPLLTAFRGLCDGEHTWPRHLDGEIDKLRVDFKGTYYLVTEVKEVIRAFTTMLNKPTAMATFMASRKATMEIYAARSKQSIPWKIWHQKDRHSHQDQLDDKREERQRM